MKNSYLSILLAISAICGFNQSALADDFVNSSTQKWQVKRLMHPSKQQIKMERKQKVFLYVGLKDWEVDTAMEQHFDRIQSMMMANVIKTDMYGNVMRNPDTGEVLTEEDGC